MANPQNGIQQMHL